MIMSVTVEVGSVIAQPSQPVAISSLFALSALVGPEVLLSVYDVNHYSPTIPAQGGTLTGNGHSLTFNPSMFSGPLAAVSDAVDFYIPFSFDPASGQYLNATYGALKDMVFIAPSNVDHNETISLLSQGASASLDLSSPGSITLLGDVRVVTQSHYVNPFPGAMPNQATPNEIIAIAQSFVGRNWSNSGCASLAGEITALAGSSLSLTAATGSPAIFPVAAHANGEWIIAFDGRVQSNPTLAQAEAVLRPGDVVTVPWTGIHPGFDDSAGHVFTVVSGTGAQAMIIDNWAILPATDGVSSDVAIAAPHPVLDVLTYPGKQPDPAGIQIYRLDTPVVTAGGGSGYAGQKLPVAGLLSAADPAGKAIVQWQIYAPAALDSLSVNGVAQPAHDAPSAVTVSSLDGVALTAGSAGTDMVQVRASNGSFWGDWQGVAATILPTPTLTAAQVLATPQSHVFAVSDSAAHMLSALDALQTASAAGLLTTISLTDAGTPLLPLTGTQFAADRTALSAISGNFALSLTLDQPNETLIGIAGHADIAICPGASSGWALIPWNNGTTVTAFGPGTTDVFTNILQVQFADKTMTLAQGNSMNQAVALLYQAAFGRAPDATGLNFWDNIAQTIAPAVKTAATLTAALADSPVAGGGSIAANFVASSEFVAKYGALNDMQFVTQLYANVLDRAADSGGLSFWTGVLAAKSETRADILAGFAESAEALSNATHGFVGQSGNHAAWLILM